MMKNCYPRFVSEFQFTMFGLEEKPNGKLDLQDTFHIDKGLCSSEGIFKLILLVANLAMWVQGWVAYPLFFPAFLTSWGNFFAILYQSGSLLLTTKPCSLFNSNAANDNDNEISVTRLVKFTWVCFPLSSVIGCLSTALYWTYRPMMNLGSNSIVLSDVTAHGGVLIILLLQGLLLDRVPIRLKHSAFIGIFFVLYKAWLVIQNNVIEYNPFDDDDDDALYDAFGWKKDVGTAVSNTLITAFLIVPFFIILLWGLSLPGRRYLETSDKENDQEYSTERFDGVDDEDENSQEYGAERLDGVVDEGQSHESSNGSEVRGDVEEIHEV